MRHNRGHMTRFIKILYFFSLSFILIAGWWLLPKLILIRKIICQSQFGFCNPLVQDALKKAENLDIRSSQGMIKLALLESSLVKDYSIQFKLPDTLEVEVIERKPRFALTNETKSTFALIDRDGEVISLAASSNLPYLVIKEVLQNPGEKVSTEALFALEIVAGISSYYSIQTASLEKESLNVYLVNAPSLVFPLKGDKEALLGSANLILNQLKRENGNSKIENADKVSLIDLRFKNPVIR